MARPNENNEAYWLEQIDCRPSTRFKAKPLANAMKKTVAKHNLASHQSAAIAESTWRQIVGSELADYSRPGKLARGRLVVQVTDNIVQQELSFRKSEIVRKLQQLPEFARVRDLKFVVRK